MKVMCNTCGCRFDAPDNIRLAGMTPEKAILCEEVACPDCGSYDIYPDTAAGSRKAVKDQTSYENKVDILFKD